MFVTTKTRRFFLFNEKILLRSSFLLQKYCFSFKLQTFCREILRFNTILSSKSPFRPLFLPLLSPIPYYI